MASSAISNLLAVFKGDPSSVPPPVRFIPASYLFVQAEPLPDGTQPSELQNFGEVTLEGLAPVPLDQLAWGYLPDSKSRHVLLFAAFRDRLMQDGLSPDDSFYHVLPSFFAAAPADPNIHWVFLWEAGYVTALHYLAGEAIPTRIEVEKAADDTVAAAFAARELLLKRIGAATRNEAVSDLLAQPEAVCGPRDRLTFSFAHYASADAQPVRQPGRATEGLEARWTADLRGTYFAAIEQKRRRAKAQSTQVLKIAAYAAILLLAGQLTFYWLRHSVNAANSLVKTRQSEADLVLAKQNLLKQIQRFTDYQLHPMEMIGTVDIYRPKTVYFNNAKVFTSDDKNQTLAKFVADCVATDSNSMNQFLDQLKNSGLVAINADPHASTGRFGSVSFQLDLTFNSMPPPEAMPPPAPPPLPDLPPSPDNTDQTGEEGAPQPQGGPGQFQGGPGGQGQFQGGQGQFQGGGGQGQFQGGQPPEGGPPTDASGAPAPAAQPAQEPAPAEQPAPPADAAPAPGP